MPMEQFKGSFTQQEPIPEEGIAAAMAVLRHGRLHRYNTAPGEVAETALLEEEFAAFTGARYCLAVASGGYAMACALRALGVGAGDCVLSNGFTKMSGWTLRESANQRSRWSGRTSTRSSET